MAESQPLSEIFIHKEKNQKKNNMTKGQIDNLEKYTKAGKLAIGKKATDDKQIRREANFIKNIHIDDSFQKLQIAGLLTEGNDNWYFKCMHQLGTAFVMAQAETALSQGKNPPALFHFLLNKAMNKAKDPYMPRLNQWGR